MQFLTAQFLTAQWKHLILANYEVAPQLLEPYVPAKRNQKKDVAR